MAKNLKLNIKNAQIAQAIDLGGLKSKLAKKKELPPEVVAEEPIHAIEPVVPAMKDTLSELQKEEAPRVRARTKSAFAEPSTAEVRAKEPSHDVPQGSP